MTDAQLRRPQPIAGRTGLRLLLRRILLCLLLLAPFAYVGQLLSVLVHEVLGHGLAAVFLGGRFSGFQIDFNGMGRAYVDLPPDAAAWKGVVLRLAGVTSTIVAGLCLLPLSARIRKPSAGLPILVLGVCLLLERMFQGVFSVSAFSISG